MPKGVAITNPQVGAANASINCVILRFNASFERRIASILLMEFRTVLARSDWELTYGRDNGLGAQGSIVSRTPSLWRIIARM